MPLPTGACTMKIMAKHVHYTYVITLSCILLLCLQVRAQEDERVIYYGKKYLNLNIRSTEKCNQRVQRQQQKLLKQLKCKERKFAKRLKRQDSVAFLTYQQDPITFDSIGKMQQTDSATRLQRSKRYASSSIDSLRRINAFIESKANVVGTPSEPNSAYSHKMNTESTKAGYNQYLGDLIQKRTKNLKNINASTKGGIKGFAGIDKSVFYSNEKVKVFQQIKDEPSRLEEKSLEYLQGHEGFDNCLKGNPGGMEALAGKGIDATALQKMGYQTKQQMNAQLQKKLGGSGGGIQQQMSKDVAKWQDKANKLMTAGKGVRQKSQELRNSQSSLKRFGKIDKPSFKVNPMKAQPLTRRIEKQINWQTTRATLDGKPAIFQVSAMAGYKHTPNLTYGVGIAPSIGLGQNWSNIRISFEGLGLRSFAEWKWIYGIGLYAGYERTYKMAAFDDKTTETNLVPNKHNTAIYNEAIVAGLTKTYSINEKWSGSIQVLYDVWWKEKSLRSPIIIRFATIKK